MKIKVFILGFLICALLASCSNGVSIVANDTDQSTAIPFTPTPTATPTPEARVVLGEVAMRNGDYDTALSQFQIGLTSSDPEIAAEAQLGIGRIYLLKQNFTKAVQELGWLINSGPAGDSRNKAFFFLAKSYEGMKSYSRAADAYQGYLNQVQTVLEGDILKMQGDDLFTAGEYSKALQVYTDALDVARPEYQDELQLKIAQATAATGDEETALSLYQALYERTSNKNTKSTINLYMGRIYLDRGDAESAYDRFQLTVNGGLVNAGDSFSQLAALVDANQPVNELMRGEIDYFAGQYGMAVAALDRYMAANPNHDDTPHYFKALSLYNMGDYQGEVAEWDTLIRDHPNGQYYASAFLEKATTQMYHLSQYRTAAQTLLTFVTISPDAPEAANYLFRAARIYEQNGDLDLAAQTWERVIIEYPSNEDAILAQFEAGICLFRLQRYSDAQIVFQKNSMLASGTADRARAFLWVGKSLEKQYQHDEALTYYQQAASADPTGYYSIRAQEILNSQPPFPSETNINIGVNWAREEKFADDWMREKFNIANDIDLNSAGDLANNILYQRGDAFYNLGMLSNASSEFESLRLELKNDPLNSYRLLKHMVDLGINYTAVYTARQILDLTGLDQSSFIDTAPAYFNHIRFGTYYSDLIIPTANENGIDPLLLFSLVRLESVFEPEIVSSWGAVGLMQITPETGTEIFADIGWPSDYTSNDLYRPIVNIKFGTHYFAKWYNYFDKNPYAALAAYNGGIGNAMTWQNISGDDPDLFLEVIRASETRDYIRYITEYHEIYKKIYFDKNQ
jgi:soluble lytic murein transglycosylase